MKKSKDPAKERKERMVTERQLYDLMLLRIKIQGIPTGSKQHFWCTEQIAGLERALSRKGISTRDIPVTTFIGVCNLSPPPIEIAYF